jgi:hypothetical protein
MPSSKLDRIALWLAVAPPFVLGSLLIIGPIVMRVAWMIGNSVVGATFSDSDLSENPAMVLAMLIYVAVMAVAPILWLVAGALYAIPRLKQRWLHRTRNDKE